MILLLQNPCDGSAGFRDLLLGRFRETVSGDRQFFGQFAVAEDFDRVVLAFQQAAGFECFEIDLVPTLEGRFELREVENQNFRRKSVVVESAFRDPHEQRRLAPFKSLAALVAGTASRSLMTARGRLTVSGAGSAADAFACFMLLNPAIDVVQNHDCCHLKKS